MLAACDPISFVHTTDVERAEAFYVGVLGLELLERSPFALVVRSGGGTIRVTPVHDHRPSGAAVLGWDVPDVAAAVDALSEAGVAFLRYEGMGQDERGIWSAPGGARVAWFADPDGNTLSITQF